MNVSRQFLIQQAVLNAELQQYPKPVFPGRHIYLRSIVKLWGEQLPAYFLRSVLEEYRTLAHKYAEFA